MMSIETMRNEMARLFTIGTLISAAFVFVGGFMYLMQYSHETLKVELLQPSLYNTSIQVILHEALHFSSVGLIGIGLFALVAMQIIRVGMLMCFYFMTHDYRFTLMCGFILFILLYSFFGRTKVY